MAGAGYGIEKKGRELAKEIVAHGAKAR